MGDEEPPRKKRRSKWDITAPPTATQSSSSSQLPPSSTSVGGVTVPPGAESSAVAAAAAAKLNAMLASQGKLLKSDPPLAKPTPPTPSLLPPPASSSNLSVATGFLKPAGLLAPPTTPPMFTNTSTPGGPHYVQDKVFVGLEQAPESFKVVDKLQGPSGTFLQHIATQTGAKVFLRGRGSGYIEPTSGKESFEALHVYISHPNKSGLSSARKLSESLIETVKKEHETFKTSQQAPLGFGSAPGYRPPPAHGYVNPYHVNFPPQGAPLPPGAPPHPGYPPAPPAPGYGPSYQGQVPPGPHGHHGPPGPQGPHVPPGPHGPPAHLGPPPPGPNYGYFPPSGGAGPPPSDPYAPSVPPPPHPGAFYPPYATGGAEYGGAPPPHPGHFHPPPPPLIPPGPLETKEQALYRPHNRSPEPPPRRKFTEQVESPPTGPSEINTPHEHFSISYTGSSNHDDHKNSGNGRSGQVGGAGEDEREMVAASRKFTEGPHPPAPVVSTTNERPITEMVAPPPHVKEAESVGGGRGVKSEGVTGGEGVADVMKPPSLPPSSRLKETSAIMPPPPSLPPRFAKAVVSEPPSTTADSASGTPSTVTDGNNNNSSKDDSVGSPKAVQQLSALVAYGDDSDSDIDT